MTGFPTHLLDGLDNAAFETICRSATSTRHKFKYGDVSVHMTRAWKLAKRLDLHKSEPLDIIDLGLGAGYFVYICRRLGHRCEGLDRPGFDLWQRIREWLGIIDIVEHTIEPNVPLPELGRFDLVTSFACPFNYARDENRLWTVAEWSFLLDQLRDRVLKTNGRLALKLRQHYPGGYEPTEQETNAFAELCRNRGASEGSPIVFEPLR